MAEQSVTLNPGESKAVSFETTPTVARIYQVSVDGLAGSFVAIKAVVEITGISVSPTSLTTAKHEYNTYLGLGYWGDPFTISITFKNPYDYDVWVRPDYAFGHLTGEPLGYVAGTLRGFVAEKLLYFRLLLDSPAIQGDYSYTVDWQKSWDPRGQNMGSNMQFVYDPDGVPRAGDDRFLKIPSGGSITMVKEGHLSSELQVDAYQCTTCGEIVTGSIEAHYASEHPGIEITCWSWGGWGGCTLEDGSAAYIIVNVPVEGAAGLHDLCVVALKAYYFVYDPGCGQLRLGTGWVTLNWRLEEFPPIALAFPDSIEITG